MSGHAVARKLPNKPPSVGLQGAEMLQEVGGM